MKLWARQLAFGLLLTAAIPATAVRAADNAEQSLLAKADYWLVRHRPDLVRESLNQVLALNPNQADALYQYGILEARAGKAAAARGYLLRLRRAAPRDPRTAELRAAIRGAGGIVPNRLADTSRLRPDNLESGGSLPPGGTPATASDAAGASAPAIADPVNPPPPLEATVRSDDNDGLIGGTPAAAPRVVPAVATGNIPAPMGQLASLEGDAAPAVTLGASGAGAASAGAAAPAAGGTGAKYRQLAQAELDLPGPVGGYQPPVATGPVPAEESLQLDIARSMAEIEAESSPTLEAGGIYRGRIGQSGLSQLNEFGLPIDGTYSPWLIGTLQVSINPVYMTAGSISTSSLGVFGANEILAAHALPEVSPGTQDAAGVLAAIGYSFGPYSAKIGDSAWGFPVNNVIGDVAYQPKFLNNSLSFRIEGQRAPVTDSVLSYAGTHASLAGPNALTGGAFGPNGTWGGVTKTGIHGSVFYDNNNIGAFGGFAVSSVEGDNVASNTEREGFFGAYFRPYRTDKSALRVGVDLIYFGFDKNLSYFTYGQGGYFSPQDYEALTFPVEYQGRTGRWSYLGSVALGVQHFNESSSPFFPNNPYAEAALVSAVGGGAYYGGAITTGLAVDLRAQAEYALSDNLALGIAGSFDNGHSYNEGTVKIYVRKMFSGASPVSMILPGTPMEGPN